MSCGQGPALIASRPDTRVSRRERRPLPRWRVTGALLELAGGMGRLLGHTDAPWASITFAGVRHTVQMQFIGQAAVDAGEALIAAIPDHPFNFPGVLLADATITAAASMAGPPPSLMVTVELLLLDQD